MKTGANPQGKGLVPTLDAWHAVQPAAVSAKSPRQVLADYFTTLLILSAEFSFKPRAGVSYFLYRAPDKWLLSLVSPREWGLRPPGVYLGECELRPDMTWQLQPTAELDSEPTLVHHLQQFHDGFIALLEGAAPLEDSLPFYAAELPYYRRLLAAGLASSLSRTLQLSQLAGISGRQWLADQRDPGGDSPVRLLPDAR